MSEEDKQLQKHLVDEMMKVSETNPDVMFYMEALMKYCIEIEQKVEQLENIRKEAIEYIEDKMELTKECPQDLLNILNKGSNKE